MKKLSILLALLLVLVMPLAQAESLVHVADQANTFSSDEIASLENKMQDIYDTYGFDTVIVTTNNSRGQSAQMYAADFYDDFRSYDDYPNGLIFSFNFDLGEYYEASRGIGIDLFTSQGEDALDSLLRPYLEERDYHGAIHTYLDSVQRRLDQYSYVDEDGELILSTTRRPLTFSESLLEAASLLPIVLIIGLVIGFISAFVMRGKLNLAQAQGGAQQYTSPGSLRLRDSSEIFLYQTVTRTKIQNNNSGGGSRGGGRSFSSSSGRSYGGRGGKL